VRAALLDGDEQAAVAAIRGGGPSAAARLAIHRHHVVQSLTRALESTFPVVVRLVDPRFFRYAADRYVRSHPPAAPCLFEYGAAFPEFLAEFEPVRALAYLPDVARLEWAMNAALHAPDAEPLAPRALDVSAPVGLHPSMALLASRWPIDAIWRANPPRGEDVAVDLAAGGARLQVWRHGDDVFFRSLSAPAFAFRAALATSGMLDAAAEAALAIDAGVDLAALVRDLLVEQVLVSAPERIRPLGAASK
jgi:hypothetical protein